jgi:3-oxoacyl-[acyl-carrier protein] reductase
VATRSPLTQSIAAAREIRKSDYGQIGMGVMTREMPLQLVGRSPPAMDRPNIGRTAGDRMKIDLTTRVAFVTAASQGIGEAIARALHGAGAKVALLARSEDKLTDIARSLGDGALAVAGDVTDAASIARAVDHVTDVLGPVDILVNNAGGVSSSDGGVFRPFDEVPDQDWLATWELNVLSVVRMTRALVPTMAKRGWGRIINISSESAVQPDPIGLEYASAKGALNTLTKALSKAYGHSGVLANIVSPAYVDTPILRNLLAQQDGADGIATDELATHFMKAFRPNIALDRPCTPEDVAAAVTFLASDAAAFITGSNLRVDGGSVSTI